MLYTVKSLKDTKKIADNFVDTLSPGSVVAFEGNLGSGKTTFIQLLCQKLGVQEYVNSPTFTIINEYQISEDIVIHHMDFYRINFLEELYEIGLPEYFTDKSITFIEWADLYRDILPPNTVDIKIMLNDNDERRIEIRNF